MKVPLSHAMAQQHTSLVCGLAALLVRQQRPEVDSEDLARLLTAWVGENSGRAVTEVDVLQAADYVLAALSEPEEPPEPDDGVTEPSGLDADAIRWLGGVPW